MKLRKAAAAIFAALLLSGCEFRAFGYRVFIEKDNVEDKRFDGPDVSTYDAEERQVWHGYDTAFISDNGMEYVWDSIEDADLRLNIAEVMRAMENHEQDITLPKPIPVDEVKTFVYFVHDYTCGYCYVEYYTYSYWSDENDELAYAIRLAYDKDKETADKMMAKLSERVNEIVKKAPEGSDYEKIKYFHDAIVDKCRYSFSGSNCYNAYGALIDGVAVCQGYSHAMQLLLSRAGFEAVTVSGTANKDYHKWNYVKLDGKWYAIDVTWDDAEDSYQYFLVSDKVMKESGHSDVYEAAYFTMPSAKKSYNK